MFDAGRRAMDSAFHEPSSDATAVAFLSKAATIKAVKFVQHLNPQEQTPLARYVEDKIPVQLPSLDLPSLALAAWALAVSSAAWPAVAFWAAWLAVALDRLREFDDADLALLVFAFGRARALDAQRLSPFVDAALHGRGLARFSTAELCNLLSGFAEAKVCDARLLEEAEVQLAQRSSMRLEACLVQLRETSPLPNGSPPSLHSQGPWMPARHRAVAENVDRRQNSAGSHTHPKECPTHNPWTFNKLSICNPWTNIHKAIVR